MKSFVLKKFDVKPDANVVVHIEGRKAGLIAWLMTLLGMDITVSLICSKDTTTYSESSLFGSVATIIPNESISAVESGQVKPLFWLALSAAVIGRLIFKVLKSDMPSINDCGLTLILALVFFILYAINKSISLRVQNGGDQYYGFKFKGSLIENIQVNKIEAQRAADAIISTVINSKNGR